MKKLFLALALLFLVAKCGAATRVALVGDNANGNIAKVLDLATVKLGAENSIELLDRTAVDRVIAEQKLSLAGAVDANSVVSVGRLLTADLFAVVDSVTQTNATGNSGETMAGLTIFDAKTGVRLWDATLSADGIEKLADSISAAVIMARGKQIAVGLPTICLMSVRNADLPRSLDSLCDSVGLLLERRLTASPGCVVLERERLDEVNKERSLPAGAQQQQLLASLVMMELECGRGTNGEGMCASARLTDNTGKLLDEFSVTNKNANADELAAKLYEKNAGALKLKPSDANEDRVKESDRFWQAAGFFLSHGDTERGLRDLEAAFALNPENLGLQRQLAGTLISYAGAQTNLLDNLHMADRGTEMFEDYARKAYKSVMPTGRRGTYAFASYLPEWAAYVENLSVDAFNDPNLSPVELAEARQLSQTIYERFCDFRIGFALPALAETVLHHPDDSIYEAQYLFHDYGYVMVTQLWNNDRVAALYPEAWSRHWLATMKDYLDFLGQLSLKRQVAEAHEISWGLGMMLSWAPTWNKVKPTEREEIWRLMADHSSPLVRAAGKLSQLNEPNKPAWNGALSPVVVPIYRSYLQDCLNDPAQNTNLLDSQLFYGIAAGNITGSEMVTFCDFMLQRNDLHPDIVNKAASYLLSLTDRESAGRAVELYDHAAAMLKQSDVRYFGGDTNQFLQDLAKQREIAEKNFAGIAEPTPPPLPPLPPAWREVRQLVDFTGVKKGITQMFRPVVQGDFVYAAGYGADEISGGHFLQLLQISLKDGMVEPLGKTTVENVAEPTRRMILQRKLSPLSKIAVEGIEPRAACVDGNNYYLGTSRGVLIFPKSGGTVEVLDQNSGLPSDEVTALDCLDGKLYVGLGESGYIVSYDLKTQQTEVLCSARRREQLSPFDNGSPLRITILVADETNHQIVFLTDQGGGGGDLESFLQPAQKSHTDVFPALCAKARAGMWSYNPAAHEFKCLQPRWPNANYCDISWSGRVSDTQLALVCRTQHGIALFDFTTDKATLLCGDCVAVGLWWGVEATLKRHSMIVNPAFHNPPQMGDRKVDADTATFVHDGWIWSAGRAGNGWPGNNFCRVSMDTGRRQDFTPLRAGDKEFTPGECFRLIGSDRALIGDQRGLWLVTFADEDAKKENARAGM
jgi:hypothetical protein